MPLTTRTMNQPVTVIQRGPLGRDDYGSEIPGELGSFDTVAYIEQIDESDESLDRRTSTADWLVLLPADSDVGRTDHILYDNVRLELMGTPWRVFNPVTRARSHIECLCRSVEG